MLKSLRDTWLRIDARSLGLFRLAFGLVLLFDWVRRYRWIKEFYSNEGVLPNHNHIFLLHDHTRVWSVLHAFSSPGEATFAFWVIAVVYALFLVGYRTRAFHALSLVMLVSLTGRNILLENSGSYLALGLLAFTLFLPLGSRFSVDALRRSMDAREEKDGDELNDPEFADDREVAAKRLWGWSPTSIAALGTLSVVILACVAHASQRTGSWLDGTALHYALGGAMSVSTVGVAARGLPSGILVAWTHLLRFSEYLIPALVLFPVLPRVGRATRGAAVALTIAYGLSFGLLFDLGLFGWTFVAAAALFIPPESWDKRLAPAPRRSVTLIYDADCGVCLWICRLLKRLDLRSHISFQGNDALANLVVRRGRGVASADMPKEVTPELVLDTVIAVTADRRIFTRGRAVAAAIGALPLGFLVAAPMHLPGISSLIDRAYDFVAARRQRISVLMGKEACGIPAASPLDHEGGYRDGGESEGRDADVTVAPATRASRVLTGGAREIGAIVVLLAMIAQTGNANPVPKLIPMSRPLAAVAQWPRMLSRWNVLTPEPSRDAEVFVVDAQTRGGSNIDTLTGHEPVLDANDHGPLALGQLWADYLTRIHEKEWVDFQRAFRDYLGKGGPRWEAPVGDNALAGYDAYWVKEPLAAPGQAPEPAAGAASREKLFTFSRGGRAGGGPRLPPIPIRPPPPPPPPKP